MVQRKNSSERPWNTITDNIEIIPVGWIDQEILKCQYSKKYVVLPPLLWWKKRVDHSNHINNS